MNDLFNLIANIVVFGVILWVINALIPMPAIFKSIINLIVLIVIVIYVLQYLGLVKNIIPMMHIFR